MLQFAAPLGLLAFGALLAPLLLHLVRRPRRVVRVGSLRPLEGDPRAVRSLRWRDHLLLALRCALLAALALSLAGLRWQPAAPPPVRWLLLVPGTALDARGQAEWQRQLAGSDEARWLAPGFPRVTTTADPPAAGAEVDAWSLLRELDARLPGGSHATVFGPTRAALFRGHRPTLAQVEVRWHAVPGDAGSPTPPSGRVRLIATPGRAEDARYLRAALVTLGATFVTDETPDWIFQLGDAALPPDWNESVQLGARLVTDAPDTAPAVDVTRWFDAGGTRVPLRRRVELTRGVPVRRDSMGEPWYTEERIGRGVHGRFALRFHPDWSDWPLSGAFPAWWREQLQPSSSALALAPEQAAPAFAPAGRRATPLLPGHGRIDLRGWCWLLAVGLLVAERILDQRSRRRRAAA